MNTTTPPTAEIERMTAFETEQLKRWKDWSTTLAACIEAFEGLHHPLRDTQVNDVPVRAAKLVRAALDAKDRELADAKADLKRWQDDYYRMNSINEGSERERDQAKAEAAVLAEKWRRYLEVSMRQQGAHSIDAAKEADADMQLIAPLATALLSKHEALKKRVVELEALLDLAGHWQDGSCQTVTLVWDDATHTAFITAGKKRYYVEGSGFHAALSELVRVRASEAV